MREILFRGRRIDNGEWIYGYYTGPVGIINDHAICDINSVSGQVLDVDPSTVGQYTGLKDRNGVRIFEGDVVREHHVTRYVDSWGRKYAVDMDEDRRGWYPFACGDGCGCCEEDTISPCYCEVIGNIHDNPELLEV